MVHWQLAAFSAPRQGNDEREYEDAWDHFPTRQRHGAFLRAAIADGATASSFAREWAALLVRTYVRHRFVTAGGLMRAVTGIAPSWWRSVFARPLPWYAEEKARRGAFSSLLGLNLAGEGAGDRSSAGNWQALAVGDSCLFQVRDESLLAAFPLQAADQFGDTPTLLGSHLARNDRVEVAVQAGRWQAGDVFLLATDALAAWFLTETGQGGQPWRHLLALSHQPAFRLWLEEGRASQRIRNDDATCVVIRLPGPDH